MVEDAAEKFAVLRAFTEHMGAGPVGRSARAERAGDDGHTGAFAAARRASAKVRIGPPLDDEADYALPVWAGVVPLHLAAAAPVNDPRLPSSIEPPPYAVAYRRPDEVI